MEPLIFLFQMLMSFKDDVLTFDVTPQSNGGKRHIYKETVKGDELLVVS